MVLPVDNRLKITSICDFTLFVIQLIHGRCYFRVLFGNLKNFYQLASIESVVSFLFPKVSSGGHKGYT